VEKDLLARFGGPTPEAMVESALRHVRMLEERNFFAIKISLKSSSVLNTIAAYRLLAGRCAYPLHIGVTEAGTLLRGAVKSAVGLGILLHEGLGDTLRVSLTHDPVNEVEAAYAILRALGLRARGPEIISCPTCGRTEIDLIGLASAVEERLAGVRENFTVAVMGCVVNGPGEAREADIGIAGGRGKGIIFRKGRKTRSVSGDTEVLLAALLEEIEFFLREAGSMS
jgi:(E)-4-hydroxy-3-methylbut-2-enyl-diphosphate synthase